MTAVIRAEGLTQGYGATAVIDGLDLRVSEGILGLLGPNGAGKTTLLRTLATVFPPRSGELVLCGEPVTSEAAARRARRQVGYLPQSFGFPPSFSVYDFVRYAAWLREVPARESHRATLRAVEFVGLAGVGKTRMRALSGGMLRRAGIAAAIVGSPRVLLLDEPTVGLDPAQRLEFRQLLRSLSGTAVVLSTHLIEDVAAVCDAVAVLAGGRIVFEGDPDGLAGAAAPGAAGDSSLERGYMTVLQGGSPW